MKMAKDLRTETEAQEFEERDSLRQYTTQQHVHRLQNKLHKVEIKVDKGEKRDCKVEEIVRKTLTFIVAQAQGDLTPDEVCPP